MALTTNDSARKFFCVSPDQRIENHKSLLTSISKQAARAKLLYGDEFPIISNPDAMSGLPILTTDQIKLTFSENDPESVLPTPHTYCWKTSGYSGVSKTFYYSQEDADLFADIWAAYAWLTGVRSNSSFWNFGSKKPMVSGELLELVKKRFITSGEIYTPIKSGMDFVKALKKASKSTGADVIAGPTIAYYLICRAVHDKQYMHDSVERVLKNDMHLPAFLARQTARLVLGGFNSKKLVKAMEHMYRGFSYAEPLSSYIEMIHEHFPNLTMYDVYGSTEVPIIGATLNKTDDALALLMPALFAELADPLEVYKAKKNPGYGVKTIPWYEWKAGMTGELIVSRPGTSLPLFRYATGDLLEIVEPIRLFVPETAVLFPEELSESVPAPAIRVIARSADAIDFETEEEMGSFMGKKIYTPQIQQAILSLQNIAWWELFRVRKGDKGPGALIFLIYPVDIPADAESFAAQVREVLMYKTHDETDTIKSADSMGLLEIRITHPDAFNEIQSEIMQKIESTSSLGQLKPRHIFTVEDRIDFSRKASRKLVKALK